MRPYFFACYVLSGFFLCWALSLAAVPAEKSQVHSYEVKTIAKGLEHPWSLVFLAEGYFLIAERKGTIHLIDAQGRTVSSFRLDRVARIGQGGLMDLTLHPDFARNRWIYYSSTVQNKQGYATALGRFRFAQGGISEQEELFIADNAAAGSKHFGSRVIFDDRGHVYLCLGDRGEREEAQDLTNHKGTIVRLMSDGSVPADNPFPAARAEIYSYGHRNIQGCVFARGKLWAHEHGPRGGDELNIVRAGGNYGWPVITYGKAYSGYKIGEGTHKKGMEQPIVYWVPSIAPSGMLFYTGDKFPSWKGNIFIGALAGRHLRRLVLQENEIVAQEVLLKNYARIREVAQDEQGYIYLLTDHAKGELLRLEPFD